MKLDELLALWNQAFVKVLDVRLHKLRAGDNLPPYILPSHLFLYSFRGSARIRFDDVPFSVSGCQALHGSKGFVLHIAVGDEDFEYYAVHYALRFPTLYRPETVPLTDRNPWLLAPYSFSPSRPVSLLNQLDRLYEIWAGGGTDGIRPLRVKALFYRWVCELLEQMDEPARSPLPSDLVGQAIRYIHHHYAESVTLERMAEALNYSVPHLVKQFKLGTGKSPIGYLIEVRMDKAKELLLRTDAALQDISEGVGYNDISYFNKTFKKYAGMTPGQYRSARSADYAGSDRHTNRIISSLVPEVSGRYNANDNENHFHYDRLNKGEDRNMIQFEKKGKLAMLVLGIALVLSACSGAGAATNSNPRPSSASASLQAETTVPRVSETISQTSQPAWPRTYTDATGNNVKLEAQPKRIIVSHFSMMEYLFALDTPPIASVLADRILNAFETLKPYVQTFQVADIGQVVTPNLEMMTELEPDLILAFSGTHNDVYEDLGKIAPVVMLSIEEMNWKERLREYAKLLGKEREADAYIAELTALMNDTRAKLAPYKDQSVTFLWPTGNGDTFYVLDDSSIEYVYDPEGLGMKSPGAFKLEDDAVSMEGVTMLDPDIIFVVDYLDGIDGRLEELNKSKVWNSLSAAKNGKVFKMDISANAGGPLAVKYVVGQIAAALVS